MSGGSYDYKYYTIADAIEAACNEMDWLDDGCVEERKTMIKDALSALPSADAKPTMTEEVREALMRLTMCAREECGMCKYKDECGFDFQYKISTENMNTILNALSAETVQGWIPVEEQPPVFPCLVCDANGNPPSVPLGIVTITDEEHGEWHIDGRLWDTKIFFKGEWCSQLGYGNRIIAWMPLPKPYKGGDDE